MSKALIVLLSTIVLLSIGSECEAEERQLLPDGCICAAPDTLIPVCGNNGVTYPNLETLRCADECEKYSIHLMHNGPCRT